MRTNLYCVYDRIGEECGAPFICKTDGIAIRQFVLAFRQNSKPEFKMDDHWLYRIGEFDTETMVLKAYDPIRLDISKYVNELEEASNEPSAV